MQITPKLQWNKEKKLKNAGQHTIIHVCKMDGQHDANESFLIINKKNKINWWQPYLSNLNTFWHQIKYKFWIYNVIFF